MAKDLLNIDLPDEVNEAPGVLYLNNNQIGLCLGTWEQFLRVASMEQIEMVMDCLNHSFHPDAKVERFKL